MLSHSHIGTEHLLLGVMGRPWMCRRTRPDVTRRVGGQSASAHPRDRPRGKRPPTEASPSPRGRRRCWAVAAPIRRARPRLLRTGHLLLGLVIEERALLRKSSESWERGGRRFQGRDGDGGSPADEGCHEPSANRHRRGVDRAREQLAGLYALPADESRRSTAPGTRPQEAKAQLALFVRFAKAFRVDPVALARSSRIRTTKVGEAGVVGDSVRRIALVGLDGRPPVALDEILWS
jgi:hypothetical protein